jgi:ABC-type transporter Mla subunit MlaD
MSIRARTADALVGLLVVGAIAVMVVGLAVTRGWTERRITIYMLSPSVQDLKEDTPVFLQGLSIGEVAGISPKVDSGAMGPPQFLVALRLRERYANGVPIQLPLGTKAEISSSGLIGAAAIALLVPLNQISAAVQPGDTIRATIRQSATDALKEVADSLKSQVSDVLKDARALLQSLERTASTAQSELASTGPELRSTLAQTRSVMERIEPMIEQARTTLATADGQVGQLGDSLTIFLSDTRRLVNDADSLTRSVNTLTADLGPDLRRTLANFQVVSAKLDWFMDQVTRRPHRLVTGVRPMPADTASSADQP